MNIITSLLGVIDLTPVTNGIADVGGEIVSTGSTVAVAAILLGGIFWASKKLLDYFRDLSDQRYGVGEYGGEPEDDYDYRYQPYPESSTPDTSMFGPNGDDVRAG